MSKSVDKLKTELRNRKAKIKPVSERIRKLREDSINRVVKISVERAKLLTKFYKSDAAKNVSAPVCRALAFKYIMENISIPIEEDQLIVGIRGSGPKEVPTYPEICCHSLDDLDLLSSREKNPYFVDDDIKKIYSEEIISFWENKSIRDIIFKKVSKDWKKAYNAGIFTEFMEQRAPGHTAGDNKIFTTGLLDLKEIISEKISKINPDDYENKVKYEQLKAMDIAADAMIIYANRYADKLKGLAEHESDPKRKSELETMEQISRRVPANAPTNFWEALQHYWYIHVGIVTEVNPWDAFSPGRLDQHLIRFYNKDISEGALDRKDAKELVEAFWLKFNNQPSPPKVGVTAQESNTYNDFTKINIGGLLSDGSNAVNELSFLILEVIDEMRTIQPNSAVLISEKNPNHFLKRSIDVIKPGFGEPPLFNFDGVVMQLLRQGKSIEDSRNGGCSGCVETGAFGKESYILSGYFNLPKVLEVTLNNGVDPITSELVGIKTGDVSNFTSFDQFLIAFEKQLRYFIDIKIAGNDIIEKIYSDVLPVPFLSLWIDDCLENALDYNSGGTRYNTQYIQFVGLGTITDSLSSIKFNVFDKKRFLFKDVLESLKYNFEDNEEMRQIFLNKTPKFGNDDDFADDIAKLVFDLCIKIVESYPDTPVRNASRRAYFLPTTVHVYFGNLCMASADGRLAKTPVSEGISPVQGADRYGIVSVFNSIGKLDHVKSAGTLLNQRISPDLILDPEVLDKLTKLIRSFFRMGSHHVQFNVVSTNMLKEAQKNPNDFLDLMVRVAGYSDYFVNLTKGLQDEIIARTEQKI